MAKAPHLVTLRDIGKVLRNDHKSALHILEKHGITPHRTETGPTGRVVRRYKIDALRWAEKWRAEKDAMYAAPAPAPEPPAATPPSPAPLPATDSTSRYIETLAQYLVHQMQQHQQALIARVDTLTAELVAERALNSDARKLLDGLRVHSEEAAKLLLNILDTMTRPQTPLSPGAIGALFNGKDDAGVGH